MRVPLFPRLLLAFLFLGLPPLLWLSLDAARRIEVVGQEATERSIAAFDAKSRQALELQALGLAAEISRFLEERVQDVRILSEFPKDPQAFFYFCRSRTAEVWRRQRSGTEAFQDYRVRLPIYSEASWIAPDGREVFRVDGDWMAPSRSLRVVSGPADTTFGVETYFQGALDMPPGAVYVSHLMGRHVGKEEQLRGAATPEEAVGGAEYKGHVRFALAVREEGILKGVVALALDHVHLMEFTQHVLPLSPERVLFPSYHSGNYAFLFDDEGWIITHPKFWDIRGLDASGQWVPPYSPDSTEDDIAAGRIPFQLDRAGFVHPNYPAVAAAVRAGKSGVTRTFNVAGVDKVMAYAPIPFRHGSYAELGIFGGVTIGALTAAFHLEAEEAGRAIARASEQTLRTGVLIAWVLALAVLAAAFWLSRAIAGPVRTMAHMAREIASGNLTARIAEGRGDELGALAAALNRMGQQLEDKDLRLRDSLEELKQSRDDTRDYAGQLEEQLRVLNHIQSISEFLGTTFDREEALRIILRTCVTGLGFDRAMLYVVAPGNGELQCLGTSGFGGGEGTPDLQAPLSLEREDCVAVRVVREGVPVRVPEVEPGQDLSEFDRQWALAAGVSGFVYVPMKIRDKVVGALGAAVRAAARPILEHRVGALQIVAGQAARAIERARLYDESNRSRAFVEAVIDSLASGLVTLDSKGQVLTLNPYAERALGMDASDCAGRALAQCGVDPALAAWLAEVVGGDRLEPAEFELATPRGRRTFTWVPSRFEGERGQGWILQFRDVTEQLAMNKALERVDRLASLGRMAAGVAHEVRNPLTGVSLLLDDLHDRLPAGEDRTLAARALQEVERLDAIVQELLDYARVDRMERSPCAVAEMIDQSLFLVKKQARAHRIALTVDVQAGLPRVQVDREKLKQALLNLYLNAMHAMEAGGTLTVTAEAADGKMAIRVGDSGPGIDQEELDRIFEPFYSLRPGGTGLGLSIAHTIVSDHGGRLEVTSEPGHGAMFTILLPVGPPDGIEEEKG